MREAFSTQRSFTGMRRVTRATTRRPYRRARTCRCGTLVPWQLLRRLELESEFYRRVM